MDRFAIVTDRLVMAPHATADYADLVAMWADPIVVRQLGGQPHTGEESWARLLRYAGSWALLGYGLWAVRLRESGAFIGDIGFLEGKRQGVAGFGSDPEIGWSLVSAYHGQGLATEAVKAALDWGGGRFRRTVAMINPENTASLAVAQRCEFRQFSTGTYKDAPTTLWEYHWPS